MLYAVSMQPSDTKRKIACPFHLTAETVERLKAAAREDVRSLNAEAEFAIRQWLAEPEPA